MKAKGLAGCYRIFISARGGAGEIVRSAHASTLFEMLFGICLCSEYRARPEVFVGNSETANRVLGACVNSLINPEQQKVSGLLAPSGWGAIAGRGFIYKLTTSLRV